MEEKNVDRIYNEYVERIVKQGAENETIRIALGRAIAAFRKNRQAALNKYPHTVMLAEEVRRIKEYSIEHMDELVDKACETIEENHGHCYKAKDKEEALAIFDRIIGTGKTVVQSKSLTAEEISLRHHLEEKGNEVFETDLGEFITQLLGNRPMHILAPAINVPREEVAALLEKYTGEKIDPTDIKAMVNTVRKILRDKFFKADFGINGANVISADTGSMFIIENEGNARLVTGAPPVEIALIGMEKVVPTLQDAFKTVEVTWRYANYKMPAYLNIISGPSKTGDIEKVITYGAHGPKELHVIFLDNGRRRMAKDKVYREALYCLRCGACLYECPVYEITAGYYGKKYLGGIGTIWDAFTTVGFEESAPMAYTCLRCGRCKKTCPLRIDTPKMVAKLRNDLKKMGYVPAPIRMFAEEILKIAESQK